MAQEIKIPEYVEFKKIEYHQVNLTKTMSVGVDWIEENGLTAERFEEILSWQDDSWNANPKGEEPTDEEKEKFDEIVWQAETMDSEEDWWTDRKGGYDINFQPIDNE